MEMDFVDFVDSDSSTSSISDDEDVEEDFELDFIDVFDGHISDSEEIQLRFGGYEYEFVDEVLPSQKCVVCLLPMRDAVQTSDCGHRFCRDCLHGILRSGHPVCPNDRTEIKEEGGFFSDKAWARDILSLRVKCQQNARGCDWIGELRHAEEHQDDCPYEDTQCSSCRDNVQRRLMETHLNEECPKRIVECGHCHDEFFFVQKQEHEEMYCKRFPLVCENNCGQEEIPREEMARHISEKCPMTIVSCGYASAGCPFQDKRAHLNDHMEASVDDHLEMTWSSLVQAKEELDNMRQKFHDLQEVNQKMADEVQGVNQKMAYVVQEVNQKMAKSFEEIRNLSLAVKNIELENIGQKKMMEDMARKTGKELKSVESKVLRLQGRVLSWDPSIPSETKQSLDDILDRQSEAPHYVRSRRTLPPRSEIFKSEVISKSGKK